MHNMEGKTQISRLLKLPPKLAAFLLQEIIELNLEGRISIKNCQVVWRYQPDLHQTVIHGETSSFLD